MRGRYESAKPLRRDRSYTYGHHVAIAPRFADLPAFATTVKKPCTYLLDAGPPYFVSRQAVIDGYTTAEFIKGVIK